MMTVHAFRTKAAPLLLTMLGMMVVQAASAKSGGVDYSWGAGALAKAHDFTVTMMLYVLYVCYAVASAMSVISAAIIYIKMQSHEGDVMKSFLTLLGSILFILGASIVFPAFFGYHIHRQENISRVITMTGAHVGTDIGLCGSSAKER